jgi:putative peptide zinc metalloprotease protein
VTGPVEGTTVLAVRPLTVIRQGEDYLVGDPLSGTYVALPEIGVSVLELLRAGHTVAAAAEIVAARDGTEVDVLDFAQALCAEGLAEPAAAGAPVEPVPVESGPRRARWATVLFGPFGWTLFGLATVGVVAMNVTRPELFPEPADLFFLSTPVRSVVAITIAGLLFGCLHELLHWLAARGEGVAARMRISRRLYLLAFETDLTRLWSIPSRRRYAPLMIGIAMHVMVLFVAQATMLGDSLGWWDLPASAVRTLAALSYLQLGLLIPQFFVFLRTDIYAVVANATGCLNLWDVTRLLVRQRLRLATAAQREELARAHPRDLEVARWFGWLYAAGLGLAAWSFVVFFVPVTVHLLTSLVRTLAAAELGQLAFWEALGFSLLTLSGELLTLWVVIRDFRNRRRARRSA